MKLIKNHISGAKTSGSRRRQVLLESLSERLQKQDYSMAELKELEIQELTSLVFRLYCIGIVLEYAEYVAF